MSTVNQTRFIGVFLCGDVMTGRGVDQVLPHPGNPMLYEAYVRDARDYVRLAESLNGPIIRSSDPASIWGDALEEMRQMGIDVRIINLETSITESADAGPGKAIHYRMHPANIGCLTAAGVDCCCLANNHVLDWGYAGLTETLQSLHWAEIGHAGAGANAVEAAFPATIDVAGKGRVLVFSLGSVTSGIPREWGASEDRPGVNLLPDLTEETARQIAGEIRALKQPGDVTIASIHWGANWGYEVPTEQIRFAHRLVDGGVDLVHGHSSHHVKAIEIYQSHLILYGCGDFLDDYEGISGHEAFRSDLRLMYVSHIDPEEGRLEEARLIPLQIKRFRLQRASAADTRWLGDLLNRLGAPFDTRVRVQDDSGAIVPHVQETEGA